MSHSRQGKSWLRPCTVDRRLATPWPADNGLVLTTAMTSVNDGVYNSQLRRAAVKAPSGDRV